MYFAYCAVNAANSVHWAIKLHILAISWKVVSIRIPVSTKDSYPHEGPAYPR